MLDSPTLSHVSVTQRKSNYRDVKKSFKTKVLFASDLAFTRTIVAGIGGSVALAVREARHRRPQVAVIRPAPAGTGRAGAAGLEHLFRADDRYQPGVDRVRKSKIQQFWRSFTSKESTSRARSKTNSINTHSTDSDRRQATHTGAIFILDLVV